MRRHLNNFLRRFGYNVYRVPANRFDATADALYLLRSFGYAPRVIIDAGANMGQWTRMVYPMFPGATFAGVCSPTERDDTIRVPAMTLDDLVTVTASDRALVKLDLETHELVALRGAGNLLSAAEVVLTEVSFYHPSAPLFLDVAIFLREHGFELYDFATLSAPISHRRLRSADAVFVKASSPLLSCRAV